MALVKRKPIEAKKERLYLLEFVLEGEVVIKCGKASGISSVDRFFTILTDIHKYYRYVPSARILRDVECEDVFTLEAKFHSMFQDKRFYPMYEFTGYTECFSLTEEEAMLAFDKIVGEPLDRSTEKQCYTCGKVKSTIEFHTNRAKKDGLNHECKQCTIDKVRSINKIHLRMYSNQVTHSKDRNHPRPSYTAKELKQWLLQQPNFSVLYEAYKNSGFKKHLVPSIDRLDPDKPYTFDNIQLLTWQENQERNAKVQGELTAMPTTVFDIKTGEELGRWSSIKQASVETKQDPKNVQRAVSTINKYGRLNRVGGYGYVRTAELGRFTEDGKLKEEFRRAV